MTKMPMSMQSQSASSQPQPQLQPQPRPHAAIRACLLVALPLAAALAPAAARAETLPLSALPEKPARYGVAKGKLYVEVRSYSVDTKVSDVAAEGPVCLVSNPPSYWIDGDSPVDGRFTTFSYDAGSTFGVERLVERADGAELERVSVNNARRYLDPTGRSRIPLHVVGKLDGLTVYAYRWASQVFLIARSTEEASVRSDGTDGLLGGSECGILYAMLRVRNGSSQVAQIRGVVPRTGKRYQVDASVSQTGRDPEPLLAVTTRFVER
jgi:hypothetical protein